MPRNESRQLIALSLALIGLLVSTASAGDVKVLPELAYKDAVDLSADERERCRIDLYLPAESAGSGFPSLLWLHGGGLTGGSKSSAVSVRVARRLAESGVAVGMAEYRMNPAVNFPAYVHDAAAAFAWLQRNIGTQGGDAKRVFIGGHSAGAYLAMMVALDPQYLAACGLDETSLAGVVAISGQAVTHFTVRAERRPGDDRIIVDDAAPLFHVTKRSFPFMVLYASDDMVLRADENRLFASALRNAGCESVIERMYAGRDHGTVFSKMHEDGDPVAADVLKVLLGSAAAAAASD